MSESLRKTLLKHRMIKPINVLRVNMKNIDRNDDFEVGLLDLDDDEDLFETFQIEYYPYADSDIKYLVMINLIDDYEGTVAFIYEQREIKKETLSKFEAKSVFELISNLSLPVTLWDEVKIVNEIEVCPDVKQAIVFNTKINKTKFEWYSSDSMNYPEKLDQLNKLVEVICDLIEPDTSGLSMPVFE